MFRTWLENEKGFNSKVAGDIISRMNRAIKMLGTETMSLESISQLEKIPAFKDMSVSVKSQIRRAIRLYAEYTDENK